MTELVSQLVSQLGINEEQAKGGAGMLFKLAQEKLSGGDFSQIADALPGVTEMINSAPETSGGGMASMIGGALSAVTGNENLAGLASLAGGFEKLGLDAATITKFAPIVIQFVQEQGGDSVKSIIEKVLK